MELRTDKLDDVSAQPPVCIDHHGVDGALFVFSFGIIVSVRREWLPTQLTRGASFRRGAPGAQELERVIEPVDKLLNKFRFDHIFQSLTSGRKY